MHNYYEGFRECYIKAFVLLLIQSLALMNICRAETILDN